MPPETRYAKKGEISIAYQVVGEGPVNLVMVNGVLSHMALFWSDPGASAMFRRLSSFARVGGAVVAMFAATYPDRCEALVLLETGAKYDWAPDYLPDQRAGIDRFWDVHFDGAEHWGEGRVIAAWAPSLTSAPGFWQAAGSAERICASPGMVRALFRGAKVMDAPRRCRRSQRRRRARPDASDRPGSPASAAGLKRAPTRRAASSVPADGWRRR